MYDLVVIGTGPGGYVCAIRAAQLGLKVAVVEKQSSHGGTCLNVGCIPSKALLHASEEYWAVGHHFAQMGIEVSSARVNLEKMMAFKDQAIEGNTKGVAFLLKKNGVDVVFGVGRVVTPGHVEVHAPGKDVTSLQTKAIVLATGSVPVSLPGIEMDERRIVSSTGALTLAEVPRHLVVIGAGVIGLELGSVWKRLGAEVTVLEYQNRILPGMDGELSKEFQKILTKQGIKFKLGQKVEAATVQDTGVVLKASPAAGGEAETLEADVVLVAVGRAPYTEGLGLDEVGVGRDGRGRVVVNGHFETNIPGIYAIGDVIDGPMLAHKAEDEGIAVAEILAGKAGHVNAEVIPSVVYTAPEVAMVGKTEEELKALGVDYRVGKFPFLANGRAKANQTPEGFVKILSDALTDRVLGVHMVGAGVGELIHECAVLMEFSGSSEDLARTCHAHPTLSEAVREAALAVDKRALHM